MIRKYFRGAGLLAITENLLMLRGLVIMPFLTRHFGPVNYGVWSQISVFTATAFPLVLLGTTSAVNRFLPGIDPKKQKHYFSAWMIFIFFMALLFALPILFLGKPISQIFFGGGDKYLVFMPLAAIWLLLNTMTSCVRTWFTIQNSAKYWSLFSVLEDVFTITAITAMLVRNENVYQLVIYSLLADLALLLIELWIIFRRYGLLSPDFSILPSLLKFGLPLVPVGFAVWGLNYVDRIFLVHYSSLEEVGIYSVAYGLAYQIIPLFARPWRTMFANSAAELYNQGKHETLQRLFERSAGLALSLSLPAAVGLFLIGKPLLTILAPDFLRGTPILLFVSLGYIFLVLDSYYEIGLGLVHKQYLGNWIYGVAIIINVILNFLLIPTWSIMGAAISTGLSFLVVLAMAMYYTNRYDLFRVDTSFVFRIVLSTTIMGVIVFATGQIVRPIVGSSAIEIALLVAVGAAVYAICLWVLGILKRREIELALSLLRR